MQNINRSQKHEQAKLFPLLCKRGFPTEINKICNAVDVIIGDDLVLRTGECAVASGARQCQHGAQSVVQAEHDVCVQSVANHAHTIVLGVMAADDMVD
jgi:hypothetical protein